MKIKINNQTFERERPGDLSALLKHDGFLEQIERHMGIALEHAATYPRMDKPRKVTITLEYTPKGYIDKQTNRLVYNRGTFKATVGSPSLPATPVDFECAVSASGTPFYNVESPDQPLQQTFRDGYDDDETVNAPDGKSAAAK